MPTNLLLPVAPVADESRGAAFRERQGNTEITPKASLLQHGYDQGR